MTTDNTTYDDYITTQESFSTANTHTGAVCRRYITPENFSDGYIIVTLFVYRMLADGTMEGESITVKVDLQKAAVTADKNGVTYGK